MRGRVMAINLDVFVVKLGDDSYSIVELPPITDISDVYKEHDVALFDEIQGDLFAEGATELRNITQNKTLNVVIKKSHATKYDLASVL